MHKFRADMEKRENITKTKKQKSKEPSTTTWIFA